MTRGERHEIERMLRDLPVPPPPPGLADAIRQDIPDTAARRVPRAALRESRRAVPRAFGLRNVGRPGLALSALAHAAVVVLAFGVGWWVRGGAIAEPNGRHRLAAALRPSPYARALPASSNGDDAAFTSAFWPGVDDASLGIAERALDAGVLPDPGLLRLEEFVNAFTYDDPAPVDDDLALGAEGAPSPFAPPDFRMLRFHVRSRAAELADRRPATLTFVVDLTPDADADRRLQLVGAALDEVLDRVRPTDRVAVVAAGATSRLVVPPTNEAARVRSALVEMRPEAGADPDAGVELGYEVARQAFRRGTANHVIVCAGGEAIAALARRGSPLWRADRDVPRAIGVSAVEFGEGASDDTAVDDAFDRVDGGRPSFEAATTRGDARRVLVEKLTDVPQTIGTDADVQVAFNPKVVGEWQLFGYETVVRPAPRRAVHRAAGEIAADGNVSALYQVRLKPWREEDRVATLSVRYRPQGQVDFVKRTKDLGLSDMAPNWEQAPRSLQLAVVAAEFGDALRNADKTRLDALCREAQQLAKRFPGREDVSRLASLAEAARHARPAVAAGHGDIAVVIAKSATEPELLHRVEPVYPDAARRAKVTGTVRLLANVEESGRVGEVRVLQSVPPLDEAAAAAVRRWTYKPAQIDGSPVRSTVTVEMSFR